MMRLALTDLYRACWTDKIHDEWIRSVMKQRPDIRQDDLERTRSLMNLHVRDCLVTGFEHHIPNINLPDDGDRHVVAAAIECNANLIVTYNLKDFPSVQLRQYRLIAQHPDVFITNLLERAPSRVCDAVARHRKSLRNPPKSVDEYLSTLKKQGLHQTVERLMKLRGSI